jgi:hypothetical protein
MARAPPRPAAQANQHAPNVFKHAKRKYLGMRAQALAYNDHDSSSAFYKSVPPQCDHRGHRPGGFLRDLRIPMPHERVHHPQPAE